MQHNGRSAICGMSSRYRNWCCALAALLLQVHLQHWLQMNVQGVVAVLSILAINGDGAWNINWNAVACPAAQVGAYQTSIDSAENTEGLRRSRKEKYVVAAYILHLNI